MLPQEEMELEALLEFMEEKLEEKPLSEIIDYGSDDEEYDRLLMDIITHAENKSMGQNTNGNPTEDQEMDMSMG